MKQIAVIVSPAAHSNQVQQLGEFSFQVKTTAPAQDNKANLAVVKLLAKHYHLPRSRVLLWAGQRSKHKIFRILD